MRDSAAREFVCNDADVQAGYTPVSSEPDRERVLLERITQGIQRRAIQTITGVGFFTRAVGQFGFGMPRQGLALFHNKWDAEPPGRYKSRNRDPELSLRCHGSRPERSSLADEGICCNL